MVAIRAKVKDRTARRNEVKRNEQLREKTPFYLD
jgi:hypothetical protein